MTNGLEVKTAGTAILSGIVVSLGLLALKTLASSGTATCNFETVEMGPVDKFKKACGTPNGVYNAAHPWDERWDYKGATVYVQNNEVVALIYGNNTRLVRSTVNQTVGTAFNTLSTQNMTLGTPSVTYKSYNEDLYAAAQEAIPFEAQYDDAALQAFRAWAEALSDKVAAAAYQRAAQEILLEKQREREAADRRAHYLTMIPRATCSRDANGWACKTATP